MTLRSPRRALAVALVAGAAALGAPSSDADGGQDVTSGGATRRRVRTAHVPPGIRIAPDRREAGKVFGTDDRFPIDDTEAYPWSTVCKVYAEFPFGDVLEGSAVLIGPRHALTAAHVVYSDEFGGWAERVEVIPGFNLGDEPFGAHLVVDMTSFAGYVDDGDSDYDVALLELSTDIGDETGWLGLTSETAGYLLGNTVNTAGFPSDIEDGLGMWAANGTVEQVDTGQLYLRGTFDAFRGQSGSGVWVREDEERSVVGVLSTETTTFNRAVRITDEIFDSLDAWIGDDGSRPDFAVTDITTTLPLLVLPGAFGDVFTDLTNGGGASAATGLELRARDAFGATILLGTEVVDVPPGIFTTETTAVRVPQGALPRTYAIEAEINPARDVSEPDYADNLRLGPELLVLPPAVPLDLGARAAHSLVAGGLARRTIDVPAGASRLKLRLWGRGAAYVVRPGGEILRLGTDASRSLFVTLPEAGTWEVVLQNPRTAFRTRNVRFRAVAR